MAKSKKEIISIQSVSKIYNLGETVVKALDNVSLSIYDNDYISIMGPSGSGKSTLLNLLSLIDRPSSGFLSFENKKIDFNDSTQNDLLRANKIGIIYQQDNLLPDFTSLENIYLAGLAAGQNKASSILKAKALLKKVGLINRLNHYPSELSGGEKQRVSIARAVINEPEIILADEPTGNLDSKSGHEIMNILDELHNRGNTIILVTHEDDIAQHAHRVIRLFDGKITEDEELKSS